MGVGRKLPDLLNNLGFDTIIHRSNNVVKGRICCRLRGRKNEKFSQTANFNENKNRIICRKWLYNAVFDWCAISLSVAKQSCELFCHSKSLRAENRIMMRNFSRL